MPKHLIKNPNSDKIMKASISIRRIKQTTHMTSFELSKIIKFKKKKNTFIYLSINILFAENGSIMIKYNISI